MAQSHGGGPAPSIPDNEVWYYAPAQVTLYASWDVLSHTFADGKGVLTFANPVTIMNTWLEGINTITDVKMPETVTRMYSYAFKGCTNLALTSLPSGITEIEDYTFKGCTNLALTSLPSGITEIADNAFYNCTNLALTSLPSGITKTNHASFCNCTNLALTSLPSGITKIAPYTFQGCTNLALTSLPSGITEIGYYAFQGCTSIQSLTIDRAEPPTLGSRAFDSTPFPIYVPASAVDTYKAASGWSTYASRIFAIPE